MKHAYQSDRICYNNRFYHHLVICLAALAFFLSVESLAADDLDGDGLSDVEELNLGTDILKIDTDGDFLTDGIEVLVLSSDPLNRQDPGGVAKKKFRHFQNEPITDIHAHLASDESGIPAHYDTIQLLTFKLGDFVGKTSTWNVAERTGWQPPTWSQPSNLVQVSEGKGVSERSKPSFQARDRKVGMWINTRLSDGPAKAVNPTMRMQHRFSVPTRPRPWDESSYGAFSKLKFWFKATIPSSWQKNSDAASFAQGGLSVGEIGTNKFFFITFNFYNSRGSFPERARVDRNTGIGQVRVELRDDSRFVTPIGNGRFTSTRHSAEKSYGFTLDRFQFEEIIAEFNRYIEDKNLDRPLFSTDPSGYEVRMVNVGVEAARDVNRDGKFTGVANIGATFRNLIMETVYYEAR